MKPIIGIVARSDKDEIGSFLYTYENYRKIVINNGGIPILILPPQDINYSETVPSQADRLTQEQIEYLYTIVNKCDGIIMPGGEKWFEYDEVICRYSLEKNIPLLGICMGMQLMAYVDNVKKEPNPQKVERNETEINHRQRGVAEVHHIKLEEKSLLKKIYQTEQVMVNSVHNYHILKTNEFKISAYSEDGIIEAIENPNKKFALGVQWHPEVLAQNDGKSNEIFKLFIESTINN